MGRIKTNVLSVTCLLFLAISGPGFAQDSPPKQKPCPATPKKENWGTWEKVADGIWKARVPRFPDDQGEKAKPEFAVLRLTRVTYDEFQKNPKDFLNKYNIFDCDVKILESCPAAKAKTEEAKDGYWYVIPPHWPGSTAMCQAYPGWLAD